MASPASIEEREKPVGEQPENPSVYTDPTGQQWTLTATGGRIKRGGTIGPGRPKDEAKKQFELNALATAKRDAKVLMNPNLQDGDAALEKAKDRAMKALPDEKIVLQDTRVIDAYTIKLVAKGWSVAKATEIAVEVAAELGLPQ